MAQQHSYIAASNFANGTTIFSSSQLPALNFYLTSLRYSWAFTAGPQVDADLSLGYSLTSGGALQAAVDVIEISTTSGLVAVNFKTPVYIPPSQFLSGQFFNPGAAVTGTLVVSYDGFFL